jgi:hypothetical protein
MLVRDDGTFVNMVASSWSGLQQIAVTINNVAVTDRRNDNLQITSGLA